jgi:hypothetical protein
MPEVAEMVARDRALGAVVPPLPRRRRCRLDRRSPGDHLIVPGDGIHAFHDPGFEHASMPMMSVPGVRREQYFAGIVAVVHPRACDAVDQSVHGQAPFRLPAR